MITKIIMEGMRFHSFHGVMSHEREVGNEFEVCMTVEADATMAIESDQIEDTISYAELYELVKEEMAIPSRLIEHVAGRIFRRVKETYPRVEMLEVKVAKLSPPVGGIMAKAEVILKG